MQHAARQVLRVVRRSNDGCEAQARSHRGCRHLTANRRRYVDGVDVPRRMDVAEHPGQQLGPHLAGGVERRIAAAGFFFRMSDHYNGG